MLSALTSSQGGADTRIENDATHAFQEPFLANDPDLEALNPRSPSQEVAKFEQRIQDLELHCEQACAMLPASKSVHSGADPRIRNGETHTSEDSGALLSYGLGKQFVKLEQKVHDMERQCEQALEAVRVYVSESAQDSAGQALRVASEQRVAKDLRAHPISSPTTPRSVCTDSCIQDGAARTLEAAPPTESKGHLNLTLAFTPTCAQKVTMTPSSPAYSKHVSRGCSGVGKERPPPQQTPCLTRAESGDIDIEEVGGSTEPPYVTNL